MERRTGDIVAHWVAAFSNSGLGVVVPHHGGRPPVRCGEYARQRILAEVARPPGMGCSGTEKVSVPPMIMA